MAQLKVETSKSRDQHHAMGASRTKKKKLQRLSQMMSWLYAQNALLIPGESLHALSSRLTSLAGKN